MRLRHAVPILLLLASAVPSVAHAVPCPPLDCGPVATAAAGGLVLAVGGGEGKPLNVYDLRTGALRDAYRRAILSADGSRVVAQDEQKLTTYAAATGRATGVARAQSGWTLAGVAADGTRAVTTFAGGSSTSFAVGDAEVSFPGRFEFDGLRGDKLYLVEYLKNGYQVRVASLATGELDPEALKDADEAALIQGQARSRVESRDGRYVFTLYVEGSGEAMIHVLDLARGTAKCIDLPGGADFMRSATYALALSKDGRRLYAAGGGAGTVVTVDVPGQKIVRVRHIAKVGPAMPLLPSASLAPDGKTLAFGLNRHVWVYDLARGRVLRHVQTAADGAVAYGSGRLWSVAQDRTLHAALS